MFSTWQHFDAVIGNPPFVRYQSHIGAARRHDLGRSSSGAPFLQHQVIGAVPRRPHGESRGRPVGEHPTPELERSDS